MLGPDTLFNTSLGKMRIRNIRPGVEVETLDGYFNVSHITKARGSKVRYALIFTNDERIDFCRQHNFFTPTGDKVVGMKLKIGDKIMTREGPWTIKKRITVITKFFYWSLRVNSHDRKYVLSNGVITT